MPEGQNTPQSDDDQSESDAENNIDTPRQIRRGLTPNEILYVRRIHDIRHLVGGEWAWDVLVTLQAGPLQYTRLLELIRTTSNESGWPGRQHRYLQDSPLNRTLRRLEQGELVGRSREIHFPYHVTYELSSAAMELIASMIPMVKWAETHSDLIDRVQQRRHTEAAPRY